MFEELYRAARTRVSELARGLSDAELDTTVAGTPEWTVRDVVAHLTGVAADSVAGRLEGAPGPDWTMPQVRSRRGRSLERVLAEWDDVGPQVEAAVANREMPLNIVHDLLTHEADVRETLGLDRPPPQGWEPAARLLVKQLAAKSVRGPGTLVLQADGEEWRGGDGEPVTTVHADLYELYRGLLSRRSRAQMRAWDWSGDPGRYLDTLPVFGPRDDDQPLPASGGGAEPATSPGTDRGAASLTDLRPH